MTYDKSAAARKCGVDADEYDFVLTTIARYPEVLEELRKKHPKAAELVELHRAGATPDARIDVQFIEPRTA